ncbi:HMA2 domain-containing protein [Nitrospira sp. KM1]|uniref:HMA2 domain-containing protein n=1 Tax=Nitrospira sp. KM1 TaxID=1936990 RepID=UPI0015642873
MLKNISSYLHMTDGRLRVKVLGIRRSPGKSLHVERLLRSLRGVTDVAVNPTTGNVLVLFDSEKVTHETILHTLKNAGYLREQSVSSSFLFTPGLVDTLSQAVGRSMAEALMERTIISLF